MTDPTGLWGAMACSIGIGMAIGGLSVWALGGTPKEIMMGVLAGGLIGAGVGMSLLLGGTAFAASWKEIIIISIPLLIGSGIVGKYLYNETQIGREPTPAEQTRINHAIALIESKGGAYKKIADGLNFTDIKIGDLLEVVGWGRQPQISWDKIILTDTLVKDEFELSFLASTLVHEYIHSCTIPGLKALPRGEMWAYSAQSDFLKKCGVYGDIDTIIDKYPTVYDDLIRELGEKFIRYRVFDPAIYSITKNNP
jgi:hypothetical protein